MKKILLPAMLLLLCFSSCLKNDEGKTAQEKTTSNIVKKDASHRTFQNSGYNDYRGQLLYLTGEGEDLTAFEAENDFDTKINDATVSWVYFDNLYNTNRSKIVQQDIAFHVLATKDLVGLSNQDPRNTLYLDAIKKYIDVLTASQYIGYSVLYESLNTLKTSSPAYVKDKASEIVAYAAADTFHDELINGEYGTDSKYIAKAREDFANLKNISALQN